MSQSVIESSIKIVSYSPYYHQELVEIWRSGVKKTHTFLSAEAFEFYHNIVDKRALTNMNVCVALSSQFNSDYAGAALGFAGWQGEMIEMLFVAPKAHRQGVGSQLLDYLTQKQGCTRVDVNEQNPQGRRFYRKYGFVEIGRSPQDDQGRAYPIMHAEIGQKSGRNRA